MEVQAESNRVEPQSPQESEPVETRAEDNTEATEPTEQQSQVQDDVLKAQEQISERELNRVQALANAKAQAEARAAQAEAMLSSLVNAQVNARPSQEQQMTQKYQSYDPKLGYPTDPREYTLFNAETAALAARTEAMKVASQSRDQAEFADMLRTIPEVATDKPLMALTSALKAENTHLSYTQAAMEAKKQLVTRQQGAVSKAVAQDTQSKNEAYVETTKGASTQRQVGTPDPSKMSLEEKEKFLRDQGAW